MLIGSISLPELHGTWAYWPVGYNGTSISFPGGDPNAVTFVQGDVYWLFIWEYVIENRKAVQVTRIGRSGILAAAENTLRDAFKSYSDNKLIVR
jgi:hypothetical protein